MHSSLFVFVYIFNINIASKQHIPKTCDYNMF